MYASAPSMIVRDTCTVVLAEDGRSLPAAGGRSFRSFTPRRKRCKEYIIWKSLLYDRSEWFLLRDIGSRWTLFSDCPRFYSRLNARVRRDANGIKRRDSEQCYKTS